MRAPLPSENEAVPVLPSILVLSALLVPVLVIAFIILYVLPHDVGGNIFAWPMNPRMSAMMLAATYLGGAYFFGIALLSREWRHVRLGLLPVTAFAGTLGIATLLHWENFSHERWAFQVWAFLYFTVPIILPVLWYRNERLSTRADVEQEGKLPSLSRWAFGALGITLAVAALLLFLFPEQMAQTWPWTLTPLTARVMAAMFILPGLTGLSLAYDGNWSSARYILQAQALPVVLMLIAAYVARADFDWAVPTSWIFIAGLVLTLILVVYTYAARKSGAA